MWQRIKLGEEIDTDLKYAMKHDRAKRTANRSRVKLTRLHTEIRSTFPIKQSSTYILHVNKGID